RSLGVDLSQGTHRARRDGARHGRPRNAGRSWCRRRGVRRDWRSAGVRMGGPLVPRAVFPDSDDIVVGRNGWPREGLGFVRRGARSNQLRERTRLAPSSTQGNRGPRIMNLIRPPSRSAMAEKPPGPPKDDDKPKAPETPPDEPRPQPVRDPPDEEPEKG